MKFLEGPIRQHSHAIKWQATQQDPDLLPMWVADMDIAPMEEVVQCLVNYARQSDYGYSYVPEGFYQAVINWEKTQHDYQVAKEDIVLMSGVVPGLSIALQAFTKPGDAVMITQPLYPPFERTIRLNNRQTITSNLLEQDNHLVMDLDDMAKKIIAHKVKLLFLCNPHNPSGRVWTRSELQALGRLAQQHGVIVVSDEIHQDLALFDHKHHSFHTVDKDFAEFSIVLTAASKTFNLAGLKLSYAFIKNPELREVFTRQQLANNQHEVATSGVLATQVALEVGHAWLADLKQLVEDNSRYVQDFFAGSKIKVYPHEGTYLMWLDLSAYGLANNVLYEQIKTEAKLLINEGTSFGEAGSGFIRLNVACSKAQVVTACDRLRAIFP